MFVIIIICCLGNVTSSPTCMGHDVCKNMNATSSTGEDTLARVLVISLRENQIVNKLSDTGTAIEKLEKLLKETREQLDRRLMMKQEASNWAHILKRLNNS